MKAQFVFWLIVTGLWFGLIACGIPLAILCPSSLVPIGMVIVGLIFISLTVWVERYLSGKGKGMKKKPDQKAEFLDKVRRDKSIRFENEKSTVIDILYLLGSVYDEREYGWAEGFEKWKARVKEYLEGKG